MAYFAIHTRNEWHSLLVFVIEDMFNWFNKVYKICKDAKIHLTKSLANSRVNIVYIVCEQPSSGSKVNRSYAKKNKRQSRVFLFILYITLITKIEFQIS